MLAIPENRTFSQTIALFAPIARPEGYKRAVGDNDLFDDNKLPQNDEEYRQEFLRLRMIIRGFSTRLDEKDAEIERLTAINVGADAVQVFLRRWTGRTLTVAGIAATIWAGWWASRGFK